MDVRTALRERDVVAQDRAYAQIERLRPLLRPGLLPRGLYRQAQMLAYRGRALEAVEKLELVLDLCEDLQVPERDRGVYHEMHAYALAALGRDDEAQAALDRIRPFQTGAQLQIVELTAVSLRALAALRRGDRAAARPLCHELLRGAAGLLWLRFLPMFPDVQAQVLAIGLDDGVEREFAERMIRDRRLRPPALDRSDWPWPLRVHALGTLVVVRDGVELKAGGKAQRKPLELLALLAAAGARALDVERTIDLLWPSLDANAPRASFDMALSRLRKLLDLPDAVQLADGRVSLHPALVWTDVAAFEACADEAERAGPAKVDRLLALYAAPLLQGDPAAPLVTDRRRQLALRFERAVVDLGGQLLTQGDAARACRLYQQALERELNAEPLYRALMAAQLALGERAEALPTFERCRAGLAASGGVAPGAATLALAQQARVQS